MTPTDFRDHEERAAMESIRRSNGVLSILRSDRTRDGLTSALARLVRRGTVSQGMSAGQSTTYRLLRPEQAEQSYPGHAVLQTVHGQASSLPLNPKAALPVLSGSSLPGCTPGHECDARPTLALDGSRLSNPGADRTGRASLSPVDLWRKLEQAALELLRTKGGSLTVDTTDRSQRNLLLTLERLVGTRTVARVITDGPRATYRLRQQELQ